MKQTFVLFLLIFGFSQVSAQAPKLVGKTAPEISLKNLEGETENLSDYRGKVVLVEFWAGWCGPCIKDMKTWLKPMYSEYKSEGFEVFAVNYDKTEASWKRSTERFQVPWPQVWDYATAEAYKDYNVEVIPTNYLVDQNGKIVARNIKGAKLSKKLDQLLSQ
ncbi:MAG: TlpA disulfide reductase family protein [Cytophagales bacterium]|nr:TlpA disulfide reductase family protein [Cytophagales bacterium]